jgi:iron complex outermembrane recepter protein
MKPNPKISAAVAAILSAPSAALVFAAPADTGTATASGELQEVVVTAERRTENLQDVPITIQAFSGEQLSQLNVTNFNDLLKYTPNVTFSGNGPGTGNIFMRGLGGIGSGNQSQTTTAAFPNVALYLDDQSMQFPARNNDPYLVDMERVEVLEGPQGTLFGGGAQAGAIRYITNKPRLDATSGSFNAGYGYTAGGDPNSQLNAVLNVPVIADTLALRAVVFSEHQGGYISNVYSTISYVPGTLPTLPVSQGGAGNPTANNANLLQNDANPVDYQGARLSALWKINDNWNFLLQQNYQTLEADGWFYAYPQDSNGTVLQPYQITAFTPAYNKDRYESTAWTLNGQFAGLKAVYTGSYMSRHIEGAQDYSNYLRSASGSAYACIGKGAPYFNPTKFPTLAANAPLQCGEPVGNWVDKVDNKHQEHEFRLTTNEDYRIRGLFGAYWEKFVLYDDMNFNYLGIQQCSPQNLAAGVNCVAAVGPQAGSFAIDPSLRENSNTAFGEDEQRGYKQTAFFASIDFDLIPKVLTVTGGTRWYHYDEFEYGSQYATAYNGTAGVVNFPNGTCTALGSCGFPIALEKTETGTRSRINVSWKITPDAMAYYTFSQGFRPGGFNRTSSVLGQPPSLQAEVPYCTYPGGVKTCIPNSDQYEKPAGYSSDNLINNEVGFKSEFFQHRLLFNVSAYYMKWENEQLSLFAPTILGNTTFNVNGPNYIIKGFEVQFVARITDGLTLQGSSSVNSSSQSNSPCLESVGVTNNPATKNNPTPAGTCVVINSATGPIPNALGAYGAPPAFSPPWMFNLRARYDWSAGGYKPFAWVGASHIASMTNNPRNYFDGNNPLYGNPPVTTLLLYTIPGYTTYDASLGVSKDNWTAEVNGSNLSNDYGPSNITSGQFIKAEIPLRPRVVNFMIRYAF